ncbi:zinc finger protein 865 [Xyrichtys novacula]|uniref:Zinc finger protein 865 n=1 Tax=Xyrichtys novacula TaxID=13765 RepID=A0AAV1FLN9_XYRNO|nr:zinc finger protein 865 [Xyrichtys novacula]
MMLGLQGSTSTSKVFRCVACSATFTGLASLLVHQATHAGALPKSTAPPQCSSSPHETLFSSMDLPSERPSPSALLPESSLPSFYICDCGEEFQDFSLMLEHKQLHVTQLQQMQPNDCNSPVSGTGCDKALPTQHLSFSPTLCLSNPKSPAEMSPLPRSKADETLEDGIAMLTPTQGQCTPPLDEGDTQPESMSDESDQMPGTVEDMTTSLLISKNDVCLPKNKDLMKLLASAYMKRPPASQSQNQNNDTVTLKQEVIQVDITPGQKPEVPPINDLSIAQLRRLLATPGIKTKAPSISKVLELSRKRVVSLTKTFSPVVVLETRQKLKDPGINGTYGRYQCGRCRRVFQNLDKLTEHHFLHKKERIKCCRRCKQLIIGRMPLRDNHVCPQLGNRTVQLSSAFKSKSPFAPKIVPFHSQNNARKVFFCPLCKHSYARRWNLKMHKCQGPRSVSPGPASPSIQKVLALRSNSKAKTDAEVNAGSAVAKSIAVGTDVTGCIKVEVTSQDSDQSAVSQMAWVHPAQSFAPFYPKTASLSGISLQQQEEENSGWDTAESDKEENDKGQWTVPLDDETEVLSSADKTSSDVEVAKSASVKHAETAPSGLRYFIRDGVKRYPCTRCQKTYSRPCTLRRHLRLCGFRPRGIGATAQSSIEGITPLNANNNRPLYPCFVCGRVFNRKDNMMVHRRNCQLRRTMSGAVGETAQEGVSVNAADCQVQVDDGSNWGIMSLPSVLPRRVTCECGVGFTSPRLLLEHLQKHAQESYTCPTCGETVSSWADYEVHLQIHMHPHHQLLKGLPQRSQPLLLRFQQQPPLQQTPKQQPPKQQLPPSVHQPAQKQTVKAAVHLPDPSTKAQRLVCTRCGNTFATRCSLRRHLTWNRCKGARVTNLPSNPPRTYHCSHCNSDFPNTISLLFHQRSGACKPAIKPVRCPVCLRWFGTLDSLQKHLLTHKQSESYRCDVCQGTYPSLKSLKNHRRRIHRIMAGDTNPKPQEQLDS